MDVGEPVVAAAVTEGEPLVIDAELVEDRGVDVVDVDGSGDDGIAEVVGFAVGHPATEAAAGEEDRIAIDMVVAAAAGVHGRGVGRAPHLTGPDDNRLVEEAAGLEIDDQGCHRLLGDGGVLGMVLDDLAMLIPGGIVAVEARAGDLDEPDAALDEPAGPEGLGGVEPLVLVGGVEAVEPADVLRLATDVDDVGDGGLHPKGRLVVGDQGLDRRAVGSGGGEASILGLKQGELATLESLGIGSDDVVDRRAGGPEQRRLMGGGEIGAAEVLQAAVGNPIVVEDDIAREIVVLFPQAVGDPGAEARGGADDPAGVEEEILLAVEREFADHRADDAQLVGDLGDAGEEIADPQPTFPLPAKLPRAAEPDPVGVRLRPLRDVRVADLRPFVGFEHRFGIEEIDMARAAVHEAEDDVAGPGARRGRRCPGGAGAEEAGERKHPEAR